MWRTRQVGGVGQQMKFETVLITGARGFIGTNLSEYLREIGIKKIIGFSYEEEDDLCKELFDEYYRGDICNRDIVFKVVESEKPRYIFHLAAQSSVSNSWSNPQKTYEISFTGARNLFDAVKEFSSGSIIQVSCSAEEYGVVGEDEMPIREDFPLRPASPYALSKVILDHTARFYFQAYGVKTIRTRAFNQTGPGQGPNFALSDFAKQIAEIEIGLRDPVLMVGNLEAKRDFTDVRDFVKALWLIVIKGRWGDVYNVCSGKAYSIRHMLDLMVSKSRKEIEIRVEPSRLREIDVPVLMGSNRKLKEQTGWQPEIAIGQTMSDLIEYWRKRAG